MKKIATIVIILSVLVTGIAFRQQLSDFAYSIIYYSPCDRPIPFSIGEIDSRFNVTSEELISDAKSAGDIWSATQNKQLFEYVPGATFTINMVYDSRQALTSKIDKLNTNLKQQQGTIDPQIATFKANQADFEKRVSSLNNQIQYWNAKGGAPKDEYDSLVAQQKSLQQEGRDLNATALALGQSTQEYNINAQNLNQTINDYQQVLQNKPEEGLYEQDGSVRKISLYIDIDKNEFLHTLTHEMGHSLGLSHNSNSKSIMYPQTTSVLTPSPNDISELTDICKKRTIVEIFIERLQNVIKYVQIKLENRA